MDKREYLYLRIILLFGLVLSLTGSLLAQGTAGKTNKTFVVNGKTVDAAVTQIDGRSYVDIESLARITNGVITVESDRIVLTMPASNSGAPSIATSPQTVPGLSKDFMLASVAELAEMREWTGAIGTMITYGLAVSGTWAQDYHDRALEALTQATVAASTESDRNALPLLKNEFDKLSMWASGVLAARQALNGERTTDPNTLRDDKTLTQITDCSRFLSAMLVRGIFTDNPSCH